MQKSYLPPGFKTRKHIFEQEHGAKDWGFWFIRSLLFRADQYLSNNYRNSVSLITYDKLKYYFGTFHTIICSLCLAGDTFHQNMSRSA
jgi:hypothetical protein